MGEAGENWVTHQNDWTPPLKYHPELKTKEPVGVVIWDLKGEEGSSHGDGEASVCKQVFAGPAETGGHREDWPLGPAEFPSPYMPGPYSLQTCLVMLCSGNRRLSKFSRELSWGGGGKRKTSWVFCFLRVVHHHSSSLPSQRDAFWGRKSYSPTWYIAIKFLFWMKGNKSSPGKQITRLHSQLSEHAVLT